MTPASQPIAALLAAAAGHKLMHAFYHAGLAGLVLISTVDSSFVPLPIPGVTDLLIILYAANHANLILLVFLATLGSALGGFLSHWVAQAGGMAFLEKHVSKRYLKPVQGWVENHAILSVALPAILPPPMPLSPFVLVAGAVKMNRKKFMIAFTTSRFARHVLAAWLGVHYGKAVLHLWNEFSARWAVTILIVFWSVTILFTAIGIWKLVQTSRSMKMRPNNPAQPTAQ
ncbi:MAG TPA: VTT domain-containing protein [Acidobacteriaceae bacterium]|nr:VTT domain-containing protein [Acidobacteriaceae bacterium]